MTLDELDSVTITVSQAGENGVEINADIPEFANDVAREYAEQAKKSAEEALESKQLAEKWAQGDTAPAGDDTRSAKSWSETAREWAESETEPDGVEGAKSAKTWAGEAEDSAEAAAKSEKNAGTSETNAKASEENAKTSETNAKASEEAALKAAEGVGNPVLSVTESDGKVTVEKADGTTNSFNAGLNILARSKAYSVGDIAYSPSLPSYLYLECTVAGTTGTTEPDFSGVTGGGVTVTDGTVTWATRSINETREQVETNSTNIITNTTNIAANTAKLVALISGTGLTRTLLAGYEITSKSKYLTGNVTLNQSWRNFDLLEIFTADPNNEGLEHALWFTWDFENMFDACATSGDSMSVINMSGGSYWEISPSTSSNTTWAIKTLEGVIRAIYGIKLST